MKKLLIAGLLALAPAVLPLAASAQGAATDAVSSPTVVLVVRHAEAAQGGGSDPALSAAGEARAAALARLAEQAAVRAVVTSQLRRTRETAAGLPDSIARSTVAVERATLASHGAAVARQALERGRGGAVLVVGHSNTVPLIVDALAGTTTGDLRHDEYDALFVVIVSPGGSTRVVRARY